ncbi:MAG: recombinase family protein [Oscillospiraceae bacterium]|nr:recombinase family protein [Oscillospiraceae bacterium]
MHHAIYVRQSLERADSVSLETQEALCRTDLPDHAEVLVYADRGFSGKNTDRPALRKLLSDIEADIVSSVIVYKLDRISRNLADFTRLLEIFRAHHVSFSSHTERFETETPMGQAMQSLLMVFAQLERETISSRVRDAAFARAKLGFDTGGTPPFGFRKIPTTLCGKHTQMLEADENAPVVTDGFRQYLLADGSLSILAKDWNERGIPTARGSIWQPESVRRVLRNPVYVRADSGVYSYLSRQGACLCIPEPLPEHHGVYLYADRRENPSKQNNLHGVYAICAPHLGIVPSEVWLACQEKLNRCRNRRTLGSSRRFLYSGLIFCAQCGAAATIVSGRSTEYLICGGKKRGKCIGIGSVWHRADAEQLLDEALTHRLAALSRRRIPNTQDPAVLLALNSANIQRAKLEQSLTDLADVDIPAVAAAITRLSKRCEQLEAAVRRADAAAESYDFPPFPSCEDAVKKSVAQCLIRRITVSGDVLQLYWN